jgi:thiol:disulfide interchange protein/DsbC/DsbD-like thiol-disulfide interchange protein
MRAILKAVLTLLALLVAAPSVAQFAPGGQKHMAAELVAEGPARPGQTLMLALHFTPQPGWHGYWSNPGDAGLGMTLDWKLPAGWKVGEPLYPVPQQLEIGGLMNHVYEGDYAVLVPVTVPAGVNLAQAVPLSVEGHWLVCTREICVPEDGSLSLTVGSQTPPDPRFDKWQAALPPLLESASHFQLAKDQLRIAIPLPASMKLADPHVFVGTAQLVDYVGAQAFARDGDSLIVTIPRKGLAQGAQEVSGILKLDNAGNGVSFAATPGEVPSGGSGLGSLWALLGAAFLGGLILNLMPCVFPILSLKAMSLARAGESEAHAKAEGLAYTAGVVLACLLLGGVLLGLRAAGSEVGWAFQLQEPGVVVALLVLAVALTANFAGVYELPSLSFSRSGGRASAFATGLLAAFVATPCTGPFMAAAMGAALLLPWWQGLLLFAMLGIGLALPFLLLGWVPALRKLLPRPGKWMDIFRKVMAVPMGLTALALLWLCWRLGGPLFALGALALALSLVAAARQVWGNPRKPPRKPRLAAVTLALAAMLALVGLPEAFHPGTRSSTSGALPAQPFTEAALASARASGKPVFVWFTADWCLTCKVNEGVAIEREATKAAFAKAGVVALVGDWTRRDPAITRFLTAHGAGGVPLYLWYAPGKDAEVLPQVLTPDSLVERAAKT